jgi:hypothetical protein
VRILVLVAAAAVLAGCGGGRSAADPICRQKARQAAEHAESMLAHYRGTTVYPADVAYLSLRGSIQQFHERDCPEPVLGRALERRLSAPDRKALIALLPRTTGGEIRKALSAD